jgi:lysophospholipase L1-like esterase
MFKLTAICSFALLAAGCGTAAVQVVPVANGAGLQPLPMRMGGRTLVVGGDHVRQWPGTYFETAFRGDGASFEVGAGAVILHVLVDGKPVATLARPKPGEYRVTGLSAGIHQLRVEVASESQAGPTRFGGFHAGKRSVAAPVARRQRQIEFIGDSHTVGYANTSNRQTCTEDEVWATTDTSRAFGVVLAKAYGADYQVNAISGRGVVRNYNGFAADTLPQAYPSALFGRTAPVDGTGWKPGVIVIALGTNDFSTPLHAGERWKTRADLHADYEATYVRFVRDLRAQHPRSLIVLWATDKAKSEVAAEVRKVAATLRASGESRLATVQIDGLSFAGCNSHPSVADDWVIAARLKAAIDAYPDAWDEPAR